MHSGKDAQGNAIPGRWDRARSPAAIDDAALARQIEQAKALGYTEGTRKPRGPAGVFVHDRATAEDGLNFYVSGHTSGAALADMEGRALHEWRYDFARAFPELAAQDLGADCSFLRRAHLYENGDVLAVFDGLGMIRIDKDSRLVWKSALFQHHHIDIAPDGDIYTLSRMTHMVPRLNARQEVAEDFVLVLDAATGREKRRVSIIEAMERSRLADVYWDKRKDIRGDLFHANSVQFLDGTAREENPAFERGRVLVSLRRTSTVVVIDLDANEVVWAFHDGFVGQHDARILPNGHLILLDNLGRAKRDDPSLPFPVRELVRKRGKLPGEKRITRSRSRILEYALPAMKLVWSYGGAPNDDFFTPSCGALQRLPNGNTLVTETDNGRALEVRPDGSLAWGWSSPHRAGAKGELVASLLEMVRIPRTYAAWLE